MLHDGNYHVTIITAVVLSRFDALGGSLDISSKQKHFRTPQRIIFVLCMAGPAISDHNANGCGIRFVAARGIGRGL